jgi:hypothetical protein
MKPTLEVRWKVCAIAFTKKSGYPWSTHSWDTLGQVTGFKPGWSYKSGGMLYDLVAYKRQLIKIFLRPMLAHMLFIS